jgi:hypothetical protein
MLAGMSDALWWIGTIVVLAGLYVMAFRMEPHWVSKEATSFTCRVREVREDTNEQVGRWRDRHAVVERGRLRLGGRVTLRSFGDRSRQHHSPPVDVLGRAPNASSRFAVYVLGGDPPRVLRVPAKSRAVPVLDSLVQPR